MLTPATAKNPTVNVMSNPVPTVSGVRSANPRTRPDWNTSNNAEYCASRRPIIKCLGLAVSVRFAVIDNEATPVPSTRDASENTRNVLGKALLQDATISLAALTLERLAIIVALISMTTQ